MKITINILHLSAKIIYILHFSEAVAQRCSVKNVYFKISQNSQENTCVGVSFLIQVEADACNFIIKDTLTQV